MLQGPGVLNYSLILRVDDSGPCHSIPATNKFMLERHRDALAALIDGPRRMARPDRPRHRRPQVRRQRPTPPPRFLLFHGSFLLHLDLGLLEKLLPLPSRQPDYRINRSHSDFLINLNVPDQAIRAALSKAWNATEPLAPLPFDQITFLAREKYGLDEWNFKF